MCEITEETLVTQSYNNQCETNLNYVSNWKSAINIYIKLHYFKFH